MTKFFSLLLAIMLATAVNAQTERGTVMLGGGMQFQAVEDVSIFTADPNIGFFFANNFAAGAQLSLISSGGSTVWGIGPYMRGYFGQSTRGKGFGQAGVSFAGGSAGGSSTAFQGKLGYASFLTKNVALEFSGNILAGNTTVFGLGIGFQIHLN